MSVDDGDEFTPVEQQAIDEADMALNDEVSGLAGHCTRCLTPVPYPDDDPGTPLPAGWKILDHSGDFLLVLCPDCVAQ
jgi:hypothetical protein